MVTIQAPSRNFVATTITVTTSVVTAPPPHLAQDRGVREELSLVLGEQAQKLELVRCQGDLPPGHRHRPLLDVNDELADLEHRFSRGADAPKRRAQPR